MRALTFTGFEPFAELTYNPSWDCAQAAAEAASATAELLAVTVEAGRQAAERLAQPDSLLIHFGVASRREEVCLERYAHNWWQDLGQTGARRLCDEHPVALESSLPLDQWVTDLSDTDGIRWRVSHDAGNYVCNATLFFSLLRAQHLPNCDAVFVHVPPCEPAVARQIGTTLGRYLRDDATR